MQEVKMRLRDVVNGYSSIQKLRAAPKVRAKLAFELAVLTKQVTDHVRAYEETRNKRVKELGEPGADGDFTIPQDQRAAFSTEMDELLNAEVVIKGDPIGIPANFEMDGLIAVVADWSQFLTVKES